LKEIVDAGDVRVPEEARACLLMLFDQLRLISDQILESDRRILEGWPASRIDDLLPWAYRLVHVA
jgi:hypothetical protein